MSTISLTETSSPITTETVALAGRGYSELRVAFGHPHYHSRRHGHCHGQQDRNSNILFHCRDPQRKGMSHVETLVAEGDDSTTTSKIITPLLSNVRSAVHEYGGGSYIGIELFATSTTTEEDDKRRHRYIIYTDFNDGHKVKAVPYCDEGKHENTENEIIQIFPPTDIVNDENEMQYDKLRFADFEYDPYRHRLLCVMEDHTNPQPSKVVNTIVSLSLEPLLLHSGLNVKKNHPKLIQIVAQGNDFYSTPKLSPDGTALAYVTWNHPHMPWFVTQLCVQPLHPDYYNNDQVNFEECIVVHGTTCPKTENDGMSVCNPCWDVTHHKLYFLSDATSNGYYNLFVWDGSFGSKCVLEQDSDFTDSKFGWMFGTSPYVISPKDGTIICHCYSNDEHGHVIFIVDPNNNNNKPSDAKNEGNVSKNAPSNCNAAVRVYGRNVIPPSSIGSLCLCCANEENDDEYLYFLGGSPTEPIGIWKWKLPSSRAEDSDNKATLVLPSIDSTKVKLDTFVNYCSAPTKITFPNRRGTHSYGYFYPPNHLSAAILPPLLVKAHGGPTAQTSTTFRMDLQYWTSRGFAILDVDYGGSLGYGRKYRFDLHGQWGIVDVNDVCDGAQYCVQQGWVDGNALCIDGGSAGGYTTLAALTFDPQHTFKVGASLYGISDITALAAETHKFESRYCDLLIGKYPQDKTIYEERSPILHCNKLHCPIILLQGTEDKIVPPNQALKMYDILKEKHIPTTLVLYQGEQHGFRMSPNIRHALHSEYSFFCQILGYTIQEEEGVSNVEIGTKIEIQK